MLGIFVALSIGFVFVGSIYVWKNALTHDRDDPIQIKQRMISTFVAALVILCITYYYLRMSSSISLSMNEILYVMGIRMTGFISALTFPLLLTALLFLGPLTTWFIEIWSMYSSFSSYLSNIRLPRTSQQQLIFIRNYIWAPLLEEFVFRVCICSVLLTDKHSFRTIVLLSPFIFGIAHLHHLINHVRIRGMTLKQGLIAVIFQLTYTTIFGSLASFIYLRTNHMMAPFISHTFCNMMGFPDITYINNTTHCGYKRRFFISSMYIVGIVSFVTFSYPLTSSSLYI